MHPLVQQCLDWLLYSPDGPQLLVQPPALPLQLAQSVLPIVFPRITFYSGSPAHTRVLSLCSRSPTCIISSPAARVISGVTEPALTLHDLKSTRPSVGARGSTATRLAAVLSECIASGCAATEVEPPPTTRPGSVPGAPADSASGTIDGERGKGNTGLPTQAAVPQPGTPQHDTAGATARHAQLGHGGPVVLVACASAGENVPGLIRRCFTHEVAVEAPDTDRRLGLLQCLLADAAGPDLTDVELQVPKKSLAKLSIASCSANPSSTVYC
jgi:hypothetical protein